MIAPCKYSSKNVSGNICVCFYQKNRAEKARKTAKLIAKKHWKRYENR